MRLLNTPTYTLGRTFQYPPKKTVISGNPSLVPEVLGIPAYTVQDNFLGRNKENH
jgi:hypothetical protein